MLRFSFLSTHGRVLLCIADDRHARMRDIATAVDITERGAQRIVADLVENGLVERTRDGRRNHYTLRDEIPVKLLTHDVSLGALLKLLTPPHHEIPSAP